MCGLEVFFSMSLCDEHKKYGFTTVMSTAKCGHVTGSGGMDLCRDCAAKKGACEACGKPIKPDGTIDDDEPPPHTD